MNEIWKVIKEYPDYEVSNFGRIKSNKNGVSKILNPYKANTGYCHIQLWKNGKHRDRGVHNLILEVFVGERPIGLQCSHLDGSRDNNHLDNLMWESPAENCRRKDNIKLDTTTVIQIRELLKQGWSVVRVSKRFGVCPQHISKIKYNQRWKIESVLLD